MAKEHSTTTKTKQESAVSEDKGDAYEQYERENYKKPIAEILGFENFGMGVGHYLKALCKDDKENLSDAGEGLADSAFTGLATVGKLIAYSDIKEVDSASVGFLVVLLAELGLNASLHAREAAHIQSRLKELNG